MVKLNNDELLNIEGGAWYSASFINAAARAIDTIIDVGRSLGTAIRRIINGSYCSI